MKIISFGTQSSETGYEYDLSIFFELTKSEYKKLENMKFCDIYEMYEHCVNVCVGYYNTTAFSENDELTLSGNVFNHNDQCFITPEFS